MGLALLSLGSNIDARRHLDLAVAAMRARFGAVRVSSYYRTPAVGYLYEPGPQGIFDELLPKYVEVQVWRALLESAAAEHGARMAAMDAATNNASDMIDRMTLYMNKVRQAAITKEIIEVVSGASS